MSSKEKVLAIRPEAVCYPFMEHQGDTFYEVRTDTEWIGSGWGEEEAWMNSYNNLTNKN